MGRGNTSVGALVAGLICLNLGLLAGLAYVWKGRVTRPAAGVEATNAQERRTITRTILVPANGPEGASRFTWRFLESDDFKQYITNLRAVACPEQTIQDIIIAEVNKLYASKEAALRLRPEHLKPWEVFAVSSQVVMERERKLRQLVREKRALLKELLGIDVPIEMASSSMSGGVANRERRFEEAYEKLPEGKRGPVRTIQEDYWAKTEELNERTMGFWEPQDYEEQNRLKVAYRDGLAKTLTQDELLNFDLATSSTASRLRSELTAFNATEQEMREIFKLRWKLDDEFSTTGPSNPNDPEAGRKRGEAYQAMEAETKALLGEQRYAEYQRSRDYQFRTLNRLAQQNGLPADTAIKAYDLQRVAREESGRLQSNRDLPPEQRNQMLQQMQSELDTTMTQLLGQRAYNEFQQNYGGGRIFYQSGPTPGRPVVAPRATPQVILAP
jgi:hypothetical protein